MRVLPHAAEPGTMAAVMGLDPAAAAAAAAAFEPPPPPPICGPLYTKPIPPNVLAITVERSEVRGGGGGIARGEGRGLGYGTPRGLALDWGALCSEDLGALALFLRHARHRTDGIHAPLSPSLPPIFPSLPPPFRPCATTRC